MIQRWIRNSLYCTEQEPMFTKHSLNRKWQSTGVGVCVLVASFSGDGMILHEISFAMSLEERECLYIQKLNRTELMLMRWEASEIFTWEIVSCNIEHSFVCLFVCFSLIGEQSIWRSWEIKLRRLFRYRTYWKSWLLVVVTVCCFGTEVLRTW